MMLVQSHGDIMVGTPWALETASVCSFVFERTLARWNICNMRGISLGPGGGGLRSMPTGATSPMPVRAGLQLPSLRGRGPTSK